MQLGEGNERMVDWCTTISNKRISCKGQLTAAHCENTILLSSTITMMVILCMGISLQIRIVELPCRLPACTRPPDPPRERGMRLLIRCITNSDIRVHYY